MDSLSFTYRGSNWTLSCQKFQEDISKPYLGFRRWYVTIFRGEKEFLTFESTKGIYSPELIHSKIDERIIKLRKEKLLKLS